MIVLTISSSGAMASVGSRRIAPDPSSTPAPRGYPALGHAADPWPQHRRRQGSAALRRPTKQDPTKTGMASSQLIWLSTSATCSRISATDQRSGAGRRSLARLRKTTGDPLLVRAGQRHDRQRLLDRAGADSGLRPDRNRSRTTHRTPARRNAQLSAPVLHGGDHGFVALAPSAGGRSGASVVARMRSRGVPGNSPGHRQQNELLRPYVRAWAPPDPFNASMRLEQRFMCPA